MVPSPPPVDQTYPESSRSTSRGQSFRGAIGERVLVGLDRVSQGRAQPQRAQLRNALALDIIPVLVRARSATLLERNLPTFPPRLAAQRCRGRFIMGGLFQAYTTAASRSGSKYRPSSIVLPLENKVAKGRLSGQCSIAVVLHAPLSISLSNSLDARKVACEMLRSRVHRFATYTAPYCAFRLEGRTMSRFFRS
jgi:hypothetical protein